MNYRHRTLLLVIAIIMLQGTNVWSQRRLDPRRVVAIPSFNWGWYDPYYVITANVHAQAELIRAQGAASVDYATARVIHAEAVSKELSNSLKRAEIYWAKRNLWEAEMLKRRPPFPELLKRRNQKKWDLLANHPELTQHSVLEGRGLNFLLHRLSNTVLAYEYTQQNGEPDAELLEYLALRPETLQQLWLQEAGAGGEQLTFRAGTGEVLDVNWWPWELRSEQFANERVAFEQARDAFVAEARASKTLSVERLQEIDQALLNLRESFHLHYTRERMLRERNYLAIRKADAFLLSLAGEIGRLQSQGNTDSLTGRLAFDPEEHGKHMLGLIKYMSRNGLEFAPSKPEGQFAYFDAFGKLKDLYKLVADVDESIQPKELE